jgi:hypothetical protein
MTERVAMTSRRRFLVLAGTVLALSVTTGVQFVTPAQSLPARLSDREFWRLVTESSEPNGFFRSDNLLSNELGFQQVIPELARRALPGRVYMGVGPEQNFTYIAATRPAMVFIVDIRRGNLDLHLMYKALFELSADRAEFVSRLFSKMRPAGLTAKSTAAEIFGAFADVPASRRLFDDNLKAIDSLLVRKRGLALSGDDVAGIRHAYNAFYSYGQRIQYSSTSSFAGSFQPDYAELMTASDREGVARSYLANEDHFKFLKSLEERNMLVPVVGNFGGRKAIRAVGRYLRERNATVSAFYLSNVEQYLRQEGMWDDFCANVATLPLDDTSTFIRSVRRPGGTAPGFGLASELGSMMTDVQSCRT